ncbi:acyl carrier protein [Kitasatospora sp. NPDC052896]|uniref:acyl carrier protein n=1 Tax=Kitasatospora sp. NPDC052896 TaxID=3364061 RepID=UPI0037C61A17
MSGVVRGATEDTAADATDDRGRLRSLPRPDRPTALLEIVCAEIRTALLMDEDEYLATDQSMFELGLSSLLAVEVLERLAERLGCTVSSTALFSYPTVAGFSDFLGSTVMPDLFGARP